MSKIFEALQQARRNTTGVEKTESQASQPLVTPTFKKKESPVRRPLVTPTPPAASMLDIENEMITLYQAIDSLMPDTQKKVIQFIGCKEGEGVSTIVHEFAKISANKLGKSVLIVDADYRKPVQHLFVGIKIFSIVPEEGCEDWIKNTLSLDKAFYQVEDSKVYLLPKFPLFSLASQSSDSSKVKDFFEKLKPRFDLVIIDSPPVTTSPESIVISKNVDGVVLVLEAEKTRWPVVENLKDRITKNGGNILGVVFNKRRYYIPDFIYRNL